MRSVLFLFLLVPMAIFAQNEPDSTRDSQSLPFREIPDYPDTFSAENVVARMVEGLGFRYYWATEGLRPEDLSFRPNAEARTTEETIDHILGLSTVILNSITGTDNVRSGEETSPLSFAEKRSQTLFNLQQASTLLRQSGVTLEEYKITFVNGENRNEFPFWNMLNGPLSDALWHTGQVVSFRRSSGNPFNSKANVLSGKVRE